MSSFDSFMSMSFTFWIFLALSGLTFISTRLLERYKQESEVAFSLDPWWNSLHRKKLLMNKRIRVSECGISPILGSIPTDDGTRGGLGLLFLHHSSSQWLPTLIDK